MRICVFGAASDTIDAVYIRRTEELVRRFGEAGHGLVFGGGATGLMGAAARGMKDTGGEITGIIPTFFRERDVELLYKDCTAIIWTETMRDRKAIMEQKSDAFVIVPGGIGTFEEAFEILTLKHLGQTDKPIAFYDIAGYFEPFREVMENGINRGFIHPRDRAIFRITETPEETLAYLEGRE